MVTSIWVDFAPGSKAAERVVAEWLKAKGLIGYKPRRQGNIRRMSGQMPVGYDDRYTKVRLRPWARDLAKALDSLGVTEMLIRCIVDGRLAWTMPPSAEAKRALVAAERRMVREVTAASAVAAARMADGLVEDAVAKLDSAIAALDHYQMRCIEVHGSINEQAAEHQGRLEETRIKWTGTRERRI